MGQLANFDLKLYQKQIWLAKLHSYFEKFERLKRNEALTQTTIADCPRVQQGQIKLIATAQTPGQPTLKKTGNT